MKNPSLRGVLVIIAVACLFAWGAPAQAQTSSDVVAGVTKPYAHPQPGISTPGTVLELPVKEGDVVKKGQLLLRQDDRQEVAELKSLDLEAGSTARVDAAEADLKLKQAELKRFEELFKNHNASQTEIDKAQSDVIYGQAQVKVAHLELEKAKVAAEKQRIKIDQMSIKSAYDGRIESINVAIGDVTDPSRPVMTIAQNDPLKVEFFLQTEQAKRLSLGQEVQVRYPDEEKWMPAKVTYKAPIADAASDTQKIGLEMKNIDNRDSGMQVLIKLPAEVAKMAKNPGSEAGAAVSADTGAKLP